MQLEPRSVEGTISTAEHRIRLSVQSHVNKIWSDRMEREDKKVWSKYETFNSVVERLGQGVSGPEISLDERPWNKAQVIFLQAMRDISNMGREAFDIRLVTTGIRITDNGAPDGHVTAMSPVASITIGANWVAN